MPMANVHVYMYACCMQICLDMPFVCRCIMSIYGMWSMSMTSVYAFVYDMWMSVYLCAVHIVCCVLGIMHQGSCIT